MRSTTTFLFLIFLIFNCHSQGVIVSGFGAETCGKVTLAYTKFSNPIGGIELDGKLYLDETNGFTQWMSGYVSAYNGYLAGAKTQIPADPLAMGFWLKNYCEKNPTHMAAYAVQIYIQEHSTKRSK